MGSSLSTDKACLLPARPLHCSGDQRPADASSSCPLVLASQQKEGGNRHRRHLEVLCEASTSSLTELVYGVFVRKAKQCCRLSSGKWSPSRLWQLTLVIPALRRLRWDCCKFKASLAKVNSRSAWASVILVLKWKWNKKEEYTNQGEGLNRVPKLITDSEVLF